MGDLGIDTLDPDGDGRAHGPDTNRRPDGNGGVENLGTGR